jgi:hypothetical protein
MKRLIVLIIILLGIFSTLAEAQVKAVHFKKLQELLPAKELKGFKRLKPTGTTQTQMGMSTSSAEVRYESIPKNPAPTSEGIDAEPTKTFEVKIADMIGMPYATMAYQMAAESESETEDSSQKTMLVKNRYKGQEEIHKGDSKSCKVGFAVANRYVVELQSSNSDSVKVLYELIDSINLDALEKLTSDK